MSDNDNILAGADMWNVYEVARAVNAVNARLRRVEAREGGQAADGDSATLRAERDAAQAKVNKHEKEMIDYIEAAAMCQRRTADLRAEVEEHRRHVATVMQREAALKREVERLRRDAVDGEVLDEYEEVTVPELEHERDQLRTERDAAQARVAALEAALRDVVHTIASGSRGYCGDHWLYTPQFGEAHYKRLRAALGEESSDAH